MMTTLQIRKKNEVYITINSKEPHVHHELADYFTFEVPEAKFLKKNPRYKYWTELFACTLLVQVSCIMV